MKLTGRIVAALSPYQLVSIDASTGESIALADGPEKQRRVWPQSLASNGLVLYTGTVGNGVFRLGTP